MRLCPNAISGRPIVKLTSQPSPGLATSPNWRLQHNADLTPLLAPRRSNSAWNADKSDLECEKHLLTVVISALELAVR